MNAAGNLEARAIRIAERASETWHGWKPTDNDAIPLSVVAGLALEAKLVPHPKVLAKVADRCTDEEVVKGIGEAWAMFWMRRPDLACRAIPLFSWLEKDDIDPAYVKAAARVARTVIKAGLPDLVVNCAHDVDVLGPAYLALRTDAAKSARGEFYTPGPVSSAIAYMVAAEMAAESKVIEPGQSVAEPAAGTGGMIRSFAEALRSRGFDPADFWWYANDISELAVAGLAVNCWLWDLGHRVIIGVADTLADPDWYHLAVKEQRGWIEYRNDVAGQIAMTTAARQAEVLLQMVTRPGEPAEPTELPPDPGEALAAETAAVALFDQPPPIENGVKLHSPRATPAAPAGGPDD